MHTCIDYNLSIELIAEASRSLGLKPKIITKIFYNYPNFRSKRYKPIYSQLNEISDRLGSLPKEWIIQLACCENPFNLVNNEISYFFKKIKKDFGISKILLEYYPVYKYSFNDFIKVSEEIAKSNSINLGILGPQNLYNGVFNSNDFFNSQKIIYQLDLLVAELHNKFNVNHKPIKNKNYFNNFDKNIRYLLMLNDNFKYFYPITKTSTLSHYKDLNKRIMNLEKETFKQDSKCLINIKFQTKTIHYKYYDPYFMKVNLFIFMTKPILILLKIKNILLRVISRNFHKNNPFKI